MISYKLFQKLLIDREIKKQDLLKMTWISSATMAKLNTNESVSLEVIVNNVRHWMPACRSIGAYSRSETKLKKKKYVSQSESRFRHITLYSCYGS